MDFLKTFFKISFLTLLSWGYSKAQTPALNLQKGTQLYKEGKYGASEHIYRLGLKEGELQQAHNFALANSLYKQKKYNEAKEIYHQLTNDSTLNNKQKSEVYHNLGNISMQQKKYDDAIASYKHALINNPTDEDTRYNLVLAQKQLQKNNQNKQQDQQQDQQQKQENKQKDPNNKNNQSPEKQEKENGQSPPSKKEPEEKDAKGQMNRQAAEKLLDSYKQSDEDTRRKVEAQERAKQTDHNQKNRRKW